MSLVKKMEKTTTEWLIVLDTFDDVIQSLNSITLDLFNTEQQFIIRTKIVKIEKYLEKINRMLKGKINAEYGKRTKDLYFGGKTDVFL